jgi:hypothetical protein
MKTGSSLTSVATRVDHLRRHARDFLARPAQIRLSATSAAPTLVLDDGTGALSFGVNDLVHDQIAEYIGVPMPYCKRMLAEAPELLAANANTTANNNDWRKPAQVRVAAKGA